MVDLELDIPEYFLKEENRNGFVVSSKMKEVWAVELDLLSVLLDACKKENLRIYIDAGSLLGAVRHKGFIPWDDDIDLVMFREDYDRLIKLSSSLFPKPYFLQCAYTDEEYIRGHAQFRNSNTTAIVNNEKGLDVKYNQGIFLDIFVLDGVYSKEQDISKQLNKIKKMDGYIYGALSFHNVCNRHKMKLTSRIKYGIMDCFGYNYVKFFSLKEDLFRACPVSDSSLVAPLAFIYETEKRIRNKHLYDETVWLDFEFMKVPAPAGYDEFLTKRYGDYMKPAQVPTTHGDVFFDTNRSYLEYRNR